MKANKIKELVLTSVLSSILSLGASVSEADVTVKGGWTVRYLEEVKQCVATLEYTDGTTVDLTHGILFIGNPAWHIPQSGSFKLFFSDKTNYSFDITPGATITPGVTDTIKVAWSDALAISFYRSVGMAVVDGAGTTVTKLMLTGSAAAIQELIHCNDVVSRANQKSDWLKPQEKAPEEQSIPEDSTKPLGYGEGWQ